MNNDDLPKFKTIMAGLTEIYGKRLTTALTEIFWYDFSEYSYEVFSKAVSDHRKDPEQGMFFPKTADLIRQIHGTDKTSKASIQDRALLAWSQIYYHITRHGVYQTMVLDDRQAMAAVKAIGGVGVLSTADNERIVWLKKEFLANYDAFENTPIERLPSSMLGLEDLHRHKLEQRGCLTDALSIANDMIEKEAIESNEASPNPLSEEERQKIGQAKGAELRLAVGLPPRDIESNKNISKGEGPKVIAHADSKEKERRRMVLEEAKSKIGRCDL